MTRIRYDILGAAKYPAIAARHIPENAIPAVLLNDFGNAFPIIRRLAKSGKFDTIFVHGKWKDNHRFTQADERRAIKDAATLSKIAYRFKVMMYFSPFLEHTSSKETMEALAKDIHSIAPNLVFVNNPMNGGGYIRSQFGINEIHNEGSPKNRPNASYIFSMDGYSSVDANVEKFKKQHFGKSKCLMFGHWIPQFNLKMTTTDSTKRPDRTAKPTKKMIDSVVFIATTEKGDTNLPAGFIYKSHAEQKHSITKQDPRAGTPVLICPVAAPNFELRDSKNNLVVRLMPTGHMPGDQASKVYRAVGDWPGFRWAEEACRKTGSPICTLVSGGKVYGKINPGFRENAYRA